MPRPSRFRLQRRLILLAAAAVWAATSYWQASKSLPEGSRTASPSLAVPAADVGFIADITAADAYSRPIVSQGIFDEVLRVVRSAQHFIILDYFLFNDRRADPPGPTAALRSISGELRDALIEQRRLHPELQVLFITDPINEVYGSVPSRDVLLLRAAGVDVVVTDVDRLRDSNSLYSGLWRLGLKWWSSPDRGAGWLPNPSDEDDSPVTFGAWARLVNFKANQRKVVIADDGHDGLVGVVGSADPHDAGSAHSNVALKVGGSVLTSLAQSELAIARFSGWQGHIEIPSHAAGAGAADADIVAGRTALVQVLTEGAILDSILEHIEAAAKGDNIDIAMFYVAHRAIVESLLEAGRRGVSVRLILDPNKDGFGHDRSGIPNRPVASELVSASNGGIHVRWYRTHGEQFHTKLVMVYGPQRMWLTAGSADLTRRSLGDYDLEANLAIEVGRTALISTQALEYFDSLWNNRAELGIEYTGDFGVYADPEQTHYWLYRFMEGTGMSAF